MPSKGLPAPNTPEELEWFAREGMGRKEFKVCSYDSRMAWPEDADNWYLVAVDGDIIFGYSEGRAQRWNPRKSLDDAAKLADAVFPAWSLHHDFGGYTCFQGRQTQEDPDLIVTNDSVDRDAICEAVREKIAKEQAP